MNQKATAFLQSAELMLRRKAEVNFRNCISRAYYGAYHEARSLAPTKRRAKIGNQHFGMHERLIRQLEARGDGTDHFSIGQSLRLLRYLRVRADYFFNEMVTDDEATFAISEARKIRMMIANAKGSAAQLCSKGSKR